MITVLSDSAVVVLGMHRSGTSLLCKAIEAVGVDFGERLIKGDQWNAKGYFEHYDIQQLDDRLLRLLGVRWSTLDISHWEDAIPWMYTLKSQAIEILQRDFSEASLWGVKDPRMCRLLPFWKGVFEELGVATKYVLALRNPLNVALSLHKRDNISVRDGVLLWLSHMARALIDSEGAQCVVVEYEYLLADPAGQLDRLCAVLNLSYGNDVTETRGQFVSTFVDQALRHNQESVDALNAHPEIPEAIKGLYADMLQMASSLPSEQDWQRLQARCQELMGAWWPSNVTSLSSPVCDALVFRESIATIGRLRSELLHENAQSVAAQSQIVAQASLLGQKDAEIMRLRHELASYAEVSAGKEAELMHLHVEAATHALDGKRNKAEMAELRERLETASRSLEQFDATKQSEVDSLIHENMRVKEELANRVALIRRYELLMKMAGVRPET